MAPMHFSPGGMALAKQKNMIKRSRYKEFTLLAGIVVALIIIFAWWIRQPSTFFSKSSKLLEWNVNVSNKSIKNVVKVFGELP